MGYDIVEAMTQIARQKNIEFEAVVQTLEAGILAAARKKYPDANNITFSFSKSEGEITITALKTVVEQVEDPINEISRDEAVTLDKTAQVGDEMDIYLDYEEFGRNAVASAKQILIQRVREAERVRIYEEFKDRVGKLVSGVVTQIDKTGLLVNLGNAEVFLPTRELIPRERFRQGDRLRAIITQVEEVSRGPQITISRVSDNFIRALFELEVPEIYERIIEIKAIAREAGDRAKIAVTSIDDRIDPIGACVGMKGVRVQAVVRELSNERIDIVLFSSNSELFVSRSLAPAKVTALDIFSEQHSMTVAVEDEKLSLAIGRGGQNARLASKLTGWKINILSDKEYHMIKRRKADLAVPVGQLDGVGPKMQERLLENDIATVQDLSTWSVEDLTEIEGIGKKTAEGLIETARQMTREIEKECLTKIKQEIAAEQLEERERTASLRESGGDTSGLFKSDAEAWDDSDEDAEKEQSEESVESHSSDTADDAPKDETIESDKA